MNNSVKSFIKGIGSVLDIYPSPSKSSEVKKTDAERLKSDWDNIGNDFRKSLRNFKVDKRD